MDHSINLRDAEMDAAIETLMRRLRNDTTNTGYTMTLQNIESRLSAIERTLNMMAQQAGVLPCREKRVTWKRGEDGAYTETTIVDRQKQGSNQFG